MPMINPVFEFIVRGLNSTHDITYKTVHCAKVKCVIVTPGSLMCVIALKKKNVYLISP